MAPSLDGENRRLADLLSGLPDTRVLWWGT